MVSASAGSGGSISPNGTVMINHGGSQTFYFYPNPGYEIEQVLIDGSLVGSTNSYTFSNVTENHTIFVSFSPLPVQTHMITASSGNNGSISPGGSVTVNHGSDQTFTFTPNPGCEIEQVLIDGESNSQAVSSGSYIFPNVTNNHSIAVSFRIQPISSYSGGDGSPGNPYLISTKADMVALSNAVQNGTTYAGNYFLLINDLVGANSLTTSIGTYDFNSFFQGIFDGGGHEIELNNAAGVFGYAVNATIRNLGVKGSVAFSMVTTAAAGSICGRATGTTISYCYNLGSISTSSPYSSSGGICGYSSSCVISNCYNLGNISASSPSYSYSGGICGYISSSSISNCYNLGNISASSFYPFAGGICGNSDKGSINNCFAANPVITAMNGNNNSADIGRISSHASSINNCHALSSMLVNGSEINSTDANGKDGNGVELSSLQAESWIAGNLGWDFSTVWTMSSGNSVNQGLPILKIVNCLPNLLVQVWNDVLSVINDPAKNGGYEFISYQWYRNGIDIPGEINGNLYLINGENDPDAQYAVRLITTDGQPIQSCPVRFSPAGNSVLRAYPNPAQKIITIAGEAIEDGDNVEIFDTNGQFICRFIATKNQTTLNISSFLKGTYIVKVNNKQVKIIKN
jgi:hypothetical protein